jgi:hypothetical protein
MEKYQALSVDTPDGKRYRCPCCGNFTLEEEPPGTYDICPVCFWEDDPIQLDDPTMPGGANKLSLDESRRNFKDFGAVEQRLRKYVRPPLPDELPPEAP